MFVPAVQSSPVPSGKWSSRWPEVFFDLVLSVCGAVLAWAGDAIADGASSIADTVGGWFS